MEVHDSVSPDEIRSEVEHQRCLQLTAALLSRVALEQIVDV